MLANMTLMPVLALLDRLQGARPWRLVVSGILAGDQERKVLREAEMLRLAAGRRLYEREWVTMELIPTDRPRRDRR